VRGRDVTLSIDWLTNNCFSATKILDLENNFRKLGSVAMLRSLIRILHASLVQIYTEMAEREIRQTITTSGMQCVSSHRRMGLVNLALSN